jgi:hypothetical protein
MEQLTQTETSKLADLEQVIERGKNTFVEVGNALSEIRDSRIYRATHATFEDYCRERWDWSKRSAYQFIAAAEVVENVRNCAQKPTTESQARPLAKLEPEQQPAAWEKAQDIAKEEGKPVTARHVEQAVAQIVTPEPIRTESDEEEIPEPESGVALVYARTAIDALNKIPKRDPSRKAAIKMISDWLEKQ